MNVRHLCLLFGLVLVASCPPAPAADQERTPVAEALPPSTIAVLEAPGLTTSLERLARSPIGRACGHPEFQEATTGVRKRIEAKWRELEAALTLTRADLAALARAPVGLAVLDLRPVPGKKDPDADLALLFDTRQGEATGEAMLAALTRAIQRKHPDFRTWQQMFGDTPVTVYPLGELEAHVALLQNHMAITVNRRTMDALLALDQEPVQPRLTGTKAYQRVSSALPSAREVFAFLNVRRVLAIEAGDRTPKEERDLHNLSLDRIAAIGFASAVTPTGIRDCLVADCPEGTGGLLRLLPERPVDREVLRHVPRDALAVAAARIDGLRVWDAFVDLLKQNDPQKARDLEEDLPAIEEMLGLSLRGEFLPSLGSDAVIYAAPAGLVPDVVAIWPLANAAAFRRCVDVLRPVLQNEWGFEAQAFDNTVLYYKPLERVCPCFAVQDGALILSLFVPSLKRALLQRTQGFESFQLPPPPEDLAMGDQPNLIVIGDFRRGFEIAYDTLYPFARNTPPEELPVDWPALPPAATLSQHFGPFELSLTRGKSKLRLQGTSPVGGAVPVALGIAALLDANKKQAEPSDAPAGAAEAGAEAEPKDVGRTVF